MSNGITATVIGWIATAPRQVIGPRGVAFASFRMASTPRYFDRSAGTWADGRTEWITVKAFRDAAFNVAASLHKGDPVIVHGRLGTSEWESESGPRTDLVIEAVALGPDLTRGQCTFARTVHTADDGAESQAREGADRVATGEGEQDDVGFGSATQGSLGLTGSDDPGSQDGDDLGPEDPFAELAESAVPVATP